MEKLSFRKFERIILPRFRKKIKEAESSEDIKKTVTSAIGDLFEKAFEGNLAFRYEDVHFKARKQPYVFLDQKLFKDEYFRSMWRDSDLQKTIDRFAETAVHRYKHLEKHREKTNSKIRMGVFADK